MKQQLQEQFHPTKDWFKMQSSITDYLGCYTLVTQVVRVMDCLGKKCFFNSGQAQNY